MKKVLLILLATLGVLEVSAKVQRVQVYFIPWSLRVFAPWPADTIRAHPFAKLEICEPSYAEAYINALGVEKMKKSPKVDVSDLRVVIDAVQEDGSVVSYLSDGSVLVEESTGKSRPVDSAFRKRFATIFGE
jgi:hypothetical protein